MFWASRPDFHAFIILDISLAIFFITWIRWIAFLVPGLISLEAQLWTWRFWHFCKLYVKRKLKLEMVEGQQHGEGSPQHTGDHNWECDCDLLKPMTRCIHPAGLPPQLLLVIQLTHSAGTNRGVVNLWTIFRYHFQRLPQALTCFPHTDTYL